MSGGSLDNVFLAVQAAAVRIVDRAQTPQHLVFGVHLSTVAVALHDLEWVLSGDMEQGAEVAAIDAFISRGEGIEAAATNVRKALDEFRATLNAMGAPTS